MKNENNSRCFTFHPNWIICCLLMMQVACLKTDPFKEYDAGIPPIPIATYATIDHSEGGQNRSYEMSVHWIKNKDYNRIELCNFGDLRINVVAFVNDQQISIPNQSFSSGFWNLEIYQGTGIITPNGFELTYWAGDGEESYHAEIEAIKL